MIPSDTVENGAAEGGRQLLAQIRDVDVGAQPYVVGKVPADVVGIFVDHDLVAVPEPVVAEAEVKIGDAEIEAAEPETAGSASSDAPDVAAAEAAGEASVLPGMIEVEAGIIGAGLVPDPLAVVVDVRGLRMALFVAVESLGAASCGAP